MLEEGLRIAPGDVFLLGVLGLVRARQGQIAEVEQLRSSLEERAKDRYTPFLSRANLAEACGDMDSACALLDQAIEEREPLAVISVADRQSEPVFHSRNLSLLSKINLV